MNLKITEACSLALHTIVLIASNPQRRYSTREIAQRLEASQAHLSKVLQRLCKAGVIKAIRGPKGGFSLDVNPEELTLLDIYEVMEGEYKKEVCMFNRPVCNGSRCIFGGLLEKINTEFYDLLSKTKLVQLADIFPESGQNDKHCREIAEK